MRSGVGPQEPGEPEVDGVGKGGAGGSCRRLPGLAFSCKDAGRGGAHLHAEGQSVSRSGLPGSPHLRGDGPLKPVLTLLWRFEFLDVSREGTGSKPVVFPVLGEAAGVGTEGGAGGELEGMTGAGLEPEVFRPVLSETVRGDDDPVVGAH